MALERGFRLCPLTCLGDQYRALWPQRSPTEPVPDDDFGLVDLPHQKDFPELEVGRAGLLGDVRFSDSTGHADIGSYLYLALRDWHPQGQKNIGWVRIDPVDQLDTEFARIGADGAAFLW